MTSLSRNASRMTLAVLMSRFFGLFREQVFAYYMGSSWASDAFWMAYRFPNLFRDLFAEGALNSALVPSFVALKDKNGLEKSLVFVGKLLIALFCLVGFLSFFGAYYSHELVLFFASGFSQISGKVELTAESAQILFGFFPWVCISAAIMGVLQALGYFFWPSVSTSLFNIVVILCATFFIEFFTGARFESRAIAFAYAFLFAAIFQAGYMLVLLKKQGFRFSISSFRCFDRDVLKVFLLLIPSFVSVASTQINVLVSGHYAASLGDGVVSWLGYAFRLFQFPLGLFGVAIASAALPVLSQKFSSDDRDGFVEVLESAAERTLAWNALAALLLWMNSKPLVEVLFQRGAFSASDTNQVAQLLQIYTPALLGYSLIKLFVPAFYAMKKPQWPTLVSVSAMLIHLVCAGPMSKNFGVRGLAGMLTITVSLNAFLLVFICQRTWRGYLFKKSLKAFFFHSVFCVFLGVVFEFVKTRSFLSIVLESNFSILFYFVMTIIVFSLWVGVGFLMKKKEMIELIEESVRRLRRLI